MVCGEGSILRPSRVTDVRTGRLKRIPWTPLGVSVLLFAPPSCGPCERFVEAIDRDLSRFTDWRSSVWLVVTDRTAVPDSVEHGGAIGLLFDHGRELHDSAGLGPDDAALVVIDVHGQVFFSKAVDGHEFPSLDDLEREARFPAIQCPECDTPDVPGLSRLPG